MCNDIFLATRQLHLFILQLTYTVGLHCRTQSKKHSKQVHQYTSKHVFNYTNVSQWRLPSSWCSTVRQVYYTKIQVHTRRQLYNRVHRFTSTHNVDFPLRDSRRRGCKTDFSSQSNANHPAPHEYPSFRYDMYHYFWKTGGSALWFGVPWCPHGAMTKFSAQGWIEGGSHNPWLRPPIDAVATVFLNSIQIIFLRLLMRVLVFLNVIHIIFLWITK